MIRNPYMVTKDMLDAIQHTDACLDFSSVGCNCGAVTLHMMALEMEPGRKYVLKFIDMGEVVA